MKDDKVGPDVTRLPEDSELTGLILHSSPHNIYVVDAEMRLVFANENCLRFIRESKGVQLTRGMPVMEILEPEHREVWRKRFSDVLAGQCGRVEETFFIEGKARSFDINYQPLNRGGSDWDQVVVFFEETTARVQREWKQKQLEGELRETIATRETLLSMIGHDLRSPVFQLNGLLFLIQQAAGERDEARLQMQAEDLEERIMHLTHTLDNLLSWSNVRRKDFTPQVRKFPIRPVIEHAIGLLKPAALRKGLMIQTDGLNGVDLVSDRELVAFITRNLLNNAIKFSRQSGRIEITVEKDTADFVEFSVKDYGVGMEPNRIVSMKEGNQFISEAGTWGERGTGLGLRLCYSFVERLNGRILIDSDKGSTSSTKVTVRLPKLE